MVGAAIRVLGPKLCAVGKERPEGEVDLGKGVLAIEIVGVCYSRVVEFIFERVSAFVLFFQAAVE